jgi:hypothetical protein
VNSGSCQCRQPVAIAVAEAECSFGVFVFTPWFRPFETRFCERGLSSLTSTTGGSSDTDNWQLTLATDPTTKGSRPVPDNPDGPRLSWYKPNSVSAFVRWRSFVSLGFLSARRRDAGCDYYPRVPSRFPGKTSGQPFPSALSCTTWGFSCDPAYAKIRWALTPPFHPYPPPSVASSRCQLSVESTKIRGKKNAFGL